MPVGKVLADRKPPGIVVDASLKVQYEAKVDFDSDLSHYGVVKGVLTNPDEGEVFAPPLMWLEALDLVLDRLSNQGLDFGRVQGLSGAGMQHGTVFWSPEAKRSLFNLDPSKPLNKQLESALAHPMSPNWQDASTQHQCDAFDAELVHPQALADATGSKAHHRFSGPQIMRFRTKYPEHWNNTARISLVSSFLASIFVGVVAAIDIADACGMNLWNVRKGAWDERLLALAAGGQDYVAALKQRLGDVQHDGGRPLGTINNYFATRYGFDPDCKIIPFTGDNPATILALPLRSQDAIVSLGTSTTFLMSTPEYQPDPAYHFMNHPCTKGLYMFMLCYKNGGLAREQVRDQMNARQPPGEDVWRPFNSTALSTPLCTQNDGNDKLRLGLFFPRPEIVPNLPAGQWRSSYDPKTNVLTPLATDFAPTDARTIIESQMLSLRLRSQKLVQPLAAPSGTKTLPPQPRRIYLVGGGSANPAIASICGQVLGSAEGVYKLDIGGNACALGAAYKAVWGCEKRPDETFEDLIGRRWDEDAFVKKIADGYQEGIWERYGDAVKGLDALEKDALSKERQK